MRIAILGNSGSGKSTLAHQLAAVYDAAELDLDTVAWVPGQVAVARPREAAVADVKSFCTQNLRWVVEGCYAALVQETLDLRPHLILLDPGLEQCLANCRSRPWEPHKYKSKAEQDERLEFLLSWVAEYYTREGDLSLSSHRALYESYDGPKDWLRALPANGSRMFGLRKEKG